MGSWQGKRERIQIPFGEKKHLRDSFMSHSLAMEDSNATELVLTLLSSSAVINSWPLELQKVARKSVRNSLSSQHIQKQYQQEDYSLD